MIWYSNVKQKDISSVHRHDSYTRLVPFKEKKILIVANIFFVKHRNG
jgi:hypothetical protein